MSIDKIIHVICDANTERVGYAFRLIFEDILGVTVNLHHSIDEWQCSEGVKINYTTDQSLGGLCFAPCGLLSEKGIKKQAVRVLERNGVPALFPVDNGLLSFDPFAAAFYMATRYEEVSEPVVDQHGRYDVYASAAYKWGFLNIAVVNRWAEELRQQILKAHPLFPFPVQTYRHISTIDVDSPYAYRGKGLLRTTGALGKMIVKRQWQEIKLRVNVLLKNRPDPFDVFEHLLSLSQQYECELLFFFLVGHYDTYDRNVSISMPAYINLLKALSDETRVGLHPSYASHDHPDRLEEEKHALEKVIHHNVTEARFHYLKQSIPKTWREMCLANLQHDYTMGYAPEPGFRAGICMPYRAYDLVQECTLPLTIHPFPLMDACFTQYLKTTPDLFQDIARPYVDEVRRCGGVLYSVFHNDVFSGMSPWVGWEHVYENFLLLAKP